MAVPAIDHDTVADALTTFVNTSIMARGRRILPDDDFETVGIDSMALLKILLFVEAEFGFWPPDEDLVDGQPPVAARARALHLPATEPLVARRLPLRGADLVLLALGSRGTSSNNALLVVHCDGPLAPERVTRSLDRLLDVCPWPAARLRRPFPWGRLSWAAGRRAALAPPPVRQRVVHTPAAFHEAVEPSSTRRSILDARLPCAS